MRMKKMAPTVLVVFGLTGSLALSAEAKPLRVPVTNIASGTNTDQNIASESAKGSAEAGLICAGTLEGVRTNLTGCIQAGDSYVCTAVSAATCVIGS